MIFVSTARRLSRGALPRRAPGLGALAAPVAAAAALLSGCFEAPPMDTDEIGYRGVAMETISNPDITNPIKLANVLPEPLPKPPVVEGGPKAGDVYQNVQVLGDLSVAEFTRTMAAITAWVSPDAGCTYCHVGNNFATDGIYTKVVSRRMMQMTMDINANWDNHVGDTGVTCLTCHRGQPVPEYIWFDQPPLNEQGGMAANSYQQNHANEEVGYTSMARDIFDRYLDGDPERIRVIAKNALPVRDVMTNEPTQDTENTYSLMFHMAGSLGVNCTYCHNTRFFGSWEMSPPQRMTAWYSLKMVPELNDVYLNPLGPVYPPSRLGPSIEEGVVSDGMAVGENGHVNAPKVNCTTCHQGVAKPFYGVSMLDDYPIWRGEDYQGPPFTVPLDPMDFRPTPERPADFPDQQPAAASATVPAAPAPEPVGEKTSAVDEAVLQGLGALPAPDTAVR